MLSCLEEVAVSSYTERVSSCGLCLDEDIKFTPKASEFSRELVDAEKLPKEITVCSLFTLYGMFELGSTDFERE